ncbi:ATP-binding protein [Tumidithrix elongata RA019]|uniref:histidine kinase n=1 Tax=Tumidithrix elongata BACA0141 TaxID=2716417 RepID=A0AAW9Q470_9CYAN|nr:ATP-binding protein [Tumidithrix elongata RA019]
MTKAKILIVEDEAIAAENLSVRLQQQGYTITGIVDSGIEAIESVDRLQPDLVLMDIMIKGDMDGISAAEQIYAQHQIPVVYMTAFADEKTLERAKQTEPFGYIVKPFKIPELRAAVEVALRKYQSEMLTRQSLEHAQAISNLREELVALVSHEFRNPLSSIRIATDMLEVQDRVWSYDEKKQRFQRIRKAVDRLTGFLDNMLTASQSESGRWEPSPSYFDLEKFCRELIEELKLISADSHTILFIKHFNEAHLDRGEQENNSHPKNYQQVARDSSVPPVFMDKKMLGHILINLLSNAVKYSSYGSSVALELEYVLDPAHQSVGSETSFSNPSFVRFHIRDQGIGISAEDRERMFESFFRSKYVGSVTGFGLGLAIVKNFVDLSKGTIAVESEMGVGTTFTVTLPWIFQSEKIS